MLMVTTMQIYFNYYRISMVKEKVSNIAYLRVRITLKLNHCQTIVYAMFITHDLLSTTVTAMQSNTKLQSTICIRVCRHII